VAAAINVRLSSSRSNASLLELAMAAWRAMPKRYYRIILIVLTVACGLSALVTAPIVLLTAAMGFDAPGSEYQVWAWIVFIVVLSIPLWFVTGAIGGWVLYLHGWLRTSLLITGTPLAGATIGWLLLQSV
jgi:hypothetical protein